MNANAATPKYFVTSGDEPNTIRFTLGAAIAEDDDYIDAFDKDGNKVESYKRVAQGQYTTNF